MKQKELAVQELLEFFDRNLTSVELSAAEDLSNIATSITNARIEMGMNQSQFAEFMKVSQSMVSKWENGDYNFTIEKIHEIAEKIGMYCEVRFTKLPKLTETSNHSNSNTNVVSLYNQNSIVSKSKISPFYRDRKEL